MTSGLPAGTLFRIGLPLKLIIVRTKEPVPLMRALPEALCCRQAALALRLDMRHEDVHAGWAPENGWITDF